MLLRICSSRTIRVVAVSLLAIALFGCGGAGSRKRFDLPAGRADATLMQFAKQAEVEIIYEAEAVQGAQTNAVTGSYEPSEALGKMLLGTGLTIDRDERTGAFAVVQGHVDDIPAKI